uniref:(northern house mosquito) hypothetical protein n=1 Tax=Culex pipiens TaxID=7175 RepID=A0A8D8BDE8_CULPI
MATLGRATATTSQGACCPLLSCSLSVGFGNDANAERSIVRHGHPRVNGVPVDTFRLAIFHHLLQEGHIFNKDFVVVHGAAQPSRESPELVRGDERAHVQQQRIFLVVVQNPGPVGLVAAEAQLALHFRLVFVRIGQPEPFAIRHDVSVLGRVFRGNYGN